ncbi:hypothetical protein, unlikely [Trypanosoma brucei gambiense DAL972]|uniref:Uncharacterized protein n=1 Tax=Trypanosoma brucei gambiense (strain MHOM/CI/86/DAL972) TaxID=679716 RepID=D0A6Z0_TRYB9|nr:hypothetical protein, unlikely [Trypanosoma brucei gambiense DAL972]CBH17441.1 hypothetical protein, unlikely [Trypanosoma brucei gambiense DAL972]|eukprot:XP_011779705.1 hypothetical protein, unlikely [Trypanosoma brucei gambiense DAL972]
MNVTSAHMQPRRCHGGHCTSASIHKHKYTQNRLKKKKRSRIRMKENGKKKLHGWKECETTDTNQPRININKLEITRLNIIREEVKSPPMQSLPTHSCTRTQEQQKRGNLFNHLFSSFVSFVFLLNLSLFFFCFSSLSLFRPLLFFPVVFLFLFLCLNSLFYFFLLCVYFFF